MRIVKRTSVFVGMNWDTRLALMVVGIAVGAAILAPVIVPKDPLQQQILFRLKPPIGLGGTKAFLLGTDALGRDILSRLLYGARISLFVATVAAIGSGLVGVSVGLVSGRYGGWLDRAFMGLVNMQLSIPFILLAITLIAVTKPGIANIIVILIATGWATYARVIRAETAKLNEAGFVEAAKSIGQREYLILWKHFLPNLVPQIVVLASMEVAKYIVLESSLSFLGLGVEPSVPTWGSMAADGREYLATHWWISTLPGLIVFGVCLSINVIGDWLRDRFDPRTKQESRGDLSCS